MRALQDGKVWPSELNEVVSTLVVDTNYPPGMSVKIGVDTKTLDMLKIIAKEEK